MAADPRTKIPLIEMSADYIRISDGHGEIVCWAAKDWTKDPSIVPAIVNAVRLACTSGTDALRSIVPPYPKGVLR